MVRKWNIAIVITVWVGGLLSGCAGPERYRPVGQLSASAEMPDPLVMLDGTPVTTSEEWFAKRRPELARLFTHYMYGSVPPAPPLRAKVLFEDDAYLDGQATLREVAIDLAPDPTGPVMHLLVATPNDVAGPVPCFVGPNFHGNHTLIDSPLVRVPTVWMRPWSAGQDGNRARAADRGIRPERYPVDRIIPRGYAVAMFYYGEVEPDDPKRKGGIRDWYAAREGAGEYTWGAVRAWAWAFSRAVDWLVTDSKIDASRIVSVGHSRNGKAALVAAAFDERIAMAIPNQSGCGGAAPSRGTAGESVKQINTTFPHWFSEEFHQFNAQPDRLPIDQNCLIAMVAPRPCLLANAVEDTWANPAGQFDAGKAAGNAYRLLGADGFAADEMPPANQLIDSTLGYHIRPGRHRMGRADWDVFLRFADKHFEKAAE